MNYKKFCMLALAFMLTFVMAAPGFAQSEKKIAAGAGLGLTYPMGDMGDLVDWALPLVGSFQYAFLPNVTGEVDVYYWLYSPEKSEKESDPLFGTLKYTTTLYQIGIGARYWIEKAFEGIYLGAGIARTNVEVEIKGWGSGDEDYTTLVLKGGYSMKIDPIILDLGIRYDAVDMSDWGDQPITLYAMALLPF